MLRAFFSQAVTVLRNMPKIRLSPRRLLHSAWARKIVSRSAAEYAWEPGIADHRSGIGSVVCRWVSYRIWAVVRSCNTHTLTWSRSDLTGSRRPQGTLHASATRRSRIFSTAY